MAHATPLSRRAALAISAAALAGSAAPLVAVARATAPSPDAILADAWAKYRAAMDYHKALSERIEPLWEATLAALPPYPEKEFFLGLTEEQREAYEERRMQEWEDAWNRTGMTAASKEQEDFLDTVADPLERTIIDTVPTTMKGVAIKAAHLLKYGRIHTLDTDKPEDLDWYEKALHKFVRQLAALSAGEA